MIIGTKTYKPYPAYKDAGVVWLGEIPEHWEMKRADSIFRYEKIQAEPSRLSADSVFHYSIPSIQETGDGVFESPSDIDSAKLRIFGERLLISKLNPRKGVVAVVNEKESPTVCSTEFVPLDVGSGDIKWAYFLLVSELTRQRLAAVVRSATRSHQRAEVDDVLKMWHVVPPPNEQHAIAAFLNRETAKIDALVTKKERLIELLQEKRSALITRAVTKGLDRDVSMRDSSIDWLRRIPAHWHVMRVRDIADSLQTGPFGSQLHADDYTDHGTPVINPVNLVGSGLVPDLECTVDPATRKRLQHHQLKDGDILFARRGEIGRCGLVTSHQAGWLCGTGCLRMRTKSDVAEPLFLLYGFSTVGTRVWLEIESVGSTMQNLNTSIIGRIPIAIPGLDEQRNILKVLARETARIEVLVASIRAAIDRLKELYTTLISAAVTGKIDVREEATASPEPAS